MGRNCEVYCKICLKTMRSDNLKGHMKVHENKSKKEEYIIRKDTVNKKEEAIGEETGRNSIVENTTHTRVEDEDLRKILEKCSEEYDEKINLGARIYRILGENKIKQESIPPLYKEALDLFVKQKQSIDQTNVTLRSWQEVLMKKI